MKEKPKKREAKVKPGKRIESSTQENFQSSAPPSPPLELQQLLVNIFKDSLAGAEPLSSVRERIQEVKQHLYNRDFTLAFGREEYLKAYALRWSPSRALAYLSMFHEIMGLVPYSSVEVVKPRQRRQSDTGSPNPRPDASVTAGIGPEEQPAVTERTEVTRVVCIGGGGGAEVVGLAGLARLSRDPFPSSDGARCARASEDHSTLPYALSVVAVDVANWTTVIAGLQSTITSPPKLSKYASEVVRANNRALLEPGIMDIKFEKEDVLEPIGECFDQTLKEADLVTIMFTLNELFSCSIAKTTRLLLKLTESLAKGSLLLVVDSPGNYSTISIGSGSDGKGEKRYPMQWLLDHTLVELVAQSGANEKGQTPRWEKLVGEDARWFRLDERLQYPVDLENMRYQMHLFRKV